MRLSNAGDATAFIEFMLEMTRDALTEVFIHAESGDYVGDDVGEMTTDVGDNVGESLQERILKLLTDDPTLSAAKLSEMLGISKRHTERILASLRNSGAIKRVGAARGGHWEVRRTPGGTNTLSR